MCIVRRELCCAGFFLGMLSAPASGQARLFFVPQGEEPANYPSGPTILRLRPAEEITLEIFVESTEPVRLGSILAVAPFFAGRGESAAGDVTILDARTDSFRSDWLFNNCVCHGSVQWGTSELSIGVFGSPGGGRIVTAARYVGEVVYQASSDACGTFSISLTDPVPQWAWRTGVWDPFGEPVPFVADEVLIDMTGYGDANRDGVVDLLDILCVLDGFQGIFDRCTLNDVDMSPCLSRRGDGIINLGDVLVVVSEFQGMRAPWLMCGSASCPPSDPGR